MELTGEGLQLTRHEAQDLGQIAAAVANGLHKNLPFSLALSEPTEEERAMAEALDTEITTRLFNTHTAEGDEQPITLPSNGYRAVHHVAEVALANTRKLL